MAEPNPYRIASRPAAPPADGTRERAMALRLAGWGASCVMGSLVAQAVVRVPVFALGLVGGTFFAACGAASALVGFVRAARSDPENRAARLVRLAVAFFANAALFAFGAFCAYVATFAFRRGRQIRSAGRVLLPPLVRRAPWATLPMRAVVPDYLRPRLAAAWRENGRSEHASVAAFARLTTDLMAVGAPPGLIEAAQRDALDEIRHAELCFSIARALDGASDGPGAFPDALRRRANPPTKTLALAELAVDSLVEGALYEGLSARVLAKLSPRCEVPVIASTLKELAADEGRHAAHGWEVVAWCLAEGGKPVAHALLGAITRLPRKARTALPQAATAGAWERYGIHGHVLEAAMHAQARADVVMRVHRMVAALEQAA